MKRGIQLIGLVALCILCMAPFVPNTFTEHNPGQFPTILPVPANTDNAKIVLHVDGKGDILQSSDVVYSNGVWLGPLSQVWTNDTSIPVIYPLSLYDPNIAASVSFGSENIMALAWYTNTPMNFRMRSVTDIGNSVYSDILLQNESGISGSTTTLGLSANGWISNAGITLNANNDTNGVNEAIITMTSGGAAPDVFVGSEPNVNPFSYGSSFVVDTNGIVTSDGLIDNGEFSSSTNTFSGATNTVNMLIYRQSYQTVTPCQFSGYINSHSDKGSEVQLSIYNNSSSNITVTYGQGVTDRDFNSQVTITNGNKGIFWLQVDPSLKKGTNIVFNQF